ncbi:MAG: methylmalonyl-CoA epimerase [Actinomycetota bacterium]|nr:methylmalonyl-CoA epimerase [Actinomycetota bacterium]
MLGKIEHIALAVADLDAAVEHYEKVWGLTVSHRERVEDQGVEEAMLPLGESYLQLLGPTGPDTTVGKFVAKRGEGLHHIAYEVDDLEGALAELKAKGVPLIDETPRLGGRGHMVAFVHPKGNHGLLVELIQRGRPRPDAQNERPNH